MYLYLLIYPYAPSDIPSAAGSKNLAVVTNWDIGIYRRGDCGVIENPFSASTVPWWCA